MAQHFLPRPCRFRAKATGFRFHPVKAMGFRFHPVKAMGFRFHPAKAMVVFPVLFQIFSLGPPREKVKDFLLALVVPASAGCSSLEIGLSLGRASDFPRCRNRPVIVVAADLADYFRLGCCSFFAVVVVVAVLAMVAFLSDVALGAQFSFLPSPDWTSPLRSKDRVGARTRNAIEHRPNLLAPLPSLYPCRRVLPASGQC